MTRQPTKSPLQAELESLHGQSIEAILRDALRRYRSREAAAQALSINRITLRKWLRDYSIDADKEIARAVLEGAV